MGVAEEEGVDDKEEERKSQLDQRLQVKSKAPVIDVD